MTWLDFCGSLSQQFNITYLLRVPARLPKEPEQVFDFLIATQQPEPDHPFRDGLDSGSLCSDKKVKNLLRLLREPENADGRGQEIHAERTAKR